MTLRRVLKKKSLDNILNESPTGTGSSTPTDEQEGFDIGKFQNEIEIKERILNVFINHHLIALDANIDDAKSIIDQKRPEQKIYKSSICDLWLRLKTIEQMGPISLVSCLRTNQLHRTEKYTSEIDNNSNENIKTILTNPRQSRLIHFHICTGSDEFIFDTDSYVGLLIFSYDNQSKFILNGHHCQRGDIIIKRMEHFSPTQKVHRSVYDGIFKWYFGRVIDEKFFGLGFVCLKRRWCFDLITYDDKNLYSYEYRIFDIYLLTHWLTHTDFSSNAQEMEVIAKNILLEQYELVKKRFIINENNELIDKWNEFIGSDSEDLQISIEKFYQTIDKDIEILFKKTNHFTALFTQNI